MPVLAVEPKGEKNAILVMDDGTRIWTPELDKAKELVGKEIPSDWTQREGNYGPQALPPKGKGAPQAAFRNTKEGQQIEQDAMNRRTALMQAVTHWDTGMEVLDLADDFYAWLNKDSTARPSGQGTEGHSTPAVEKPEGSGAASGGEAGTDPLPTDCVHPVDSRRETPSGRIRCTVCGLFID